MTTMEEIKTYVNNYIVVNDKKAMCFILGTNIVIRLAEGQYSRANFEHLITQFEEITNYIIEPRSGFVEIFYIYTP